MKYTTFKIHPKYVVYYWRDGEVRQSRLSRKLIRILYWMDKKLYWRKHEPTPLPKSQGRRGL